MMEHLYRRGYEAFLRLEKGLSLASVEAYWRDVSKLLEYLELEHYQGSIQQLQLSDLQAFVHHLNELGLMPSSQARLISSLKSFFGYLVLEEVMAENPAYLLASPKQGRYLPTVLHYEEIEALIACIDHSTPHGLRNRAILEVLYACGLRVSELTHLRLSQLYLSIGFIKVLGKGNKERLVPIGEEAIKHLNFYLDQRHQQTNIHPDSEDIVFLNRRGKQLSRIMVFMVVKDLAKAAGVNKNISPHTFRHTFATHLIEGGANLRVVQDLLGHRSITTTELYTHLDQSYLRDTLLQFHPRHRD